MNCRNTQTLLSAYVDCELTGEQMLEIRRHLADCSECREEEAEMVLLKTMLSGTPLIEPPADFEERLMQAVFQTNREEEPITMGQTISLLSGVSLVAAALTLLMLNFLAAPATQPPSANSSIALMTDDQASLSASDPFGGTPVVHTTYGGR
jgi:anti-sigma factor RsiW